MKLFFKRHLMLFIKLGILIAIVFFYRCPFQRLFGMDCPGCGMTRALLSALCLDFEVAFTYHPLFWLFGPILGYILFYNEIHMIFSVNDKFENVVMIGSIGLLLVVWVFQQFII